MPYDQARRYEEHVGDIKPAPDNEYSTSYKVRRLKVKMLEKIDKIVMKAENAFWESVEEDFPEIKTGDFIPEQALEFTQAARKAIIQWVANNYDEEQDNG